MHLLGVLVPCVSPAPTHRRVAAQQPRLLQYVRGVKPLLGSSRPSPAVLGKSYLARPLRFEMTTDII
ncbi:hypothetical protein GB937_005766, partial [Aspergillus fischeri]